MGAMTWPCYIENRIIVRRVVIRLKCNNQLKILYEPSRGKTNNVVSEQVRHYPACTSTEKR